MFAARVSKLKISPELLRDTRLQISDEFRLNDDQLGVLDHCIAWLQPRLAPSVRTSSTSSVQPGTSPVVLVHGAFGAGKTSLLVALLVFLHRVLSAVDRHNTVRVLVACQTNVAVDGILSGLQRRSLDCFVRVGSSRRIAANVLRHTLLRHGQRWEGGGGHAPAGHRRTHKADSRAAGQSRWRESAVRVWESAAAVNSNLTVRNMALRLTLPDDSQELRHMEAALAEMKAEKGLERKRRLLAKRVVAVTCAASSFEILDDCDFPIVLLDECSQMIEPASLLPLQRFHCQRLIAGGDPQQLPPTLHDVEGSAAAADGSSSQHAIGDRPVTVASCLAKPLFERLHNAGLPTRSAALPVPHAPDARSHAQPVVLRRPAERRSRRRGQAVAAAADGRPQQGARPAHIRQRAARPAGERRREQVRATAVSIRQR